MAFAKKFRSIVIAAALVAPIAVLPATQAHAAVFISVGFAPPALPVYAQPVCPGDGYIWTPGYWAYSDDGGYYWVPGVWVLPPQPGVLWTPPYWGYAGGVYGFHPGYWGPEVGFYGGVNYGFGYNGVGFEGGYWHGGVFFYNRAVGNLIGLHFTNIYYHPVPVFSHSTVAFNGGPGGIAARPTPQEMQAMHEQHFQPTPSQMSHQSFAAQDRSQFASVNHGTPAVRAAATPASFRANPNGGRPGFNQQGNRMQSPGAARPGVNQPQDNRNQNGAVRQPQTESRNATTQSHGKPAPKDEHR